MHLSKYTFKIQLENKTFESTEKVDPFEFPGAN